MEILVIGTDDHRKECSAKFAGHEVTCIPTHGALENHLPSKELIFDFLTSEAPESFAAYPDKNITVFLNTWKVSLRQLAFSAGRTVRATVFGFNGFPTMFSREVLEVSALRATDRDKLANMCSDLNTPYHIVDDRVGLVTPRVVCMIINEAYYTVQEGTATREDIDLAMKLGTNYPLGPFEWCDRIGLKYVYELLDALYQDTRDERYKISALMKKEYLTTLLDRD